MRRILLLTILFFIASAQAERVCKVYDGDTLTLCDGVKVRIAGIDAPELRQPMGKESRDYLKRLVLNREVELTCSGKSYQRPVCSVKRGRVDIEREMVGWGWAYDSPKYSGGLYQPAEAFARSQGRGVWTMPDGGQRPWDFRRK